MKIIPFHKPYIAEDDVSEVVESLKSGWLTTGLKCVEFEKSFAEYIGCKHVVAVNSCTAALHLALEAVGLKEGDVVITTPMTFAATAEVVRYFQAKPVFVDIEHDTMNIDVTQLQHVIDELKANNEIVKAIIPVHFAGQPCEMDSIMEIARRNDIKVVEDAAHILPGKYKDRSIGTIGDITCFSFYATKNITTGEGGMAVTNDDQWAERMRVMSLHGISKDAWKRYTAEGNWYYEIIAPGYKYNLTDIAAALGIAQLRKADFFQLRRSQIADRYSEALKALPQISIPTVLNDVQHSWHLYVIKLNLEHLDIDRNRFIEELKNMGIGVSVHFIPLHIHPYYRELYSYEPTDFPVAFETYQRIISLPIYPKMTDADVERVVKAVTDVAMKYRK
ncbi:DegT/DnrJ/EryC1/StrS family aminotransferase [candidate division WS5 bacterium]|uniref:DegT/DnrJ/EryC1/StrS family aminotransferase n=1 Tax=candidate division WS5 bacterium TaxID=2093353 RepID=A0A419DBE9_9BACT|nr:MAG: DegT/DnrJ/EryC1/StrS family aminotransferase [candidate division WS5 bacterium]